MKVYAQTLCAVFLGCGLWLPLCSVTTPTSASAATSGDRVDEKIYDPGHVPGQSAPAPSTPGTGQGTGPGIIVVPGQRSPAPSTQGDGGSVIVVPRTPGQATPPPGAPDSTPQEQQGQPDNRIIVPDSTIVVPTVPEVPSVPTVPPVPTVPTIPTVPELPKAVEVPTLPTVPVPPATETKPDTVVVLPESTPGQQPEQQKPLTPEERTLLTPADFLPTTPATPEKPVEAPKKDITPESKPDPQKPDNKKPDPKKDESKKDESKKPEPQKEPKKGDALSIPPDAAQTGNLDFLEGCWRGRLSGRRGNEVTDNMGSRFCFDKNGKGKHLLYDPKLRETCVGSANGAMSADGTLRVDFGDLYCPSGESWYPQGEKYMTCRNQGGQTQCFWYYPRGRKLTTGPFYRD